MVRDGIGLALIFLGASMADSDKLIVPVVLVALGIALMGRRIRD